MLCQPASLPEACFHTFLACSCSDLATLSCFRPLFTALHRHIPNSRELTPWPPHSKDIIKNREQTEKALKFAMSKFFAGAMRHIFTVMRDYSVARRTKRNRELY